MNEIKHRSEYRTSAEHQAGHAFVKGNLVDPMPFDAIDRLKSLRKKKIPQKFPKKAPAIIHISMYCNKSFPTRIFHVLSAKDGMNSHAVFFKNNFINEHLPVTEKELRLLTDLISSINPAAITMSVLAPYVVQTRKAVAAIRKISDAPIILGGKYPTIAPHEALEFADYACKGEGEFVVLKIHERLKRGENLDGILGLWYKNSDGNVLIILSGSGVCWITPAQ